MTFGGNKSHFLLCKIVVIVSRVLNFALSSNQDLTVEDVI